MPLQDSFRRIGACVLGVALLAFSGWAAADPPARVARLGYSSGTVSFSPGGEDDWVRATINRPLGSGDRLWSEARARAELQVGGAMVRMDAGTGVSILNLDDRITQLQLTQGTLSVRLRRLERDEVFEVDTPNLAFVLREPGEYRIEVDPDRDETIILVRRGEGVVYGEDASYLLDARRLYRFTGVDLREYESYEAPDLDAFDRWARDRDRAFDNSVSARYVSPDVIGYQDLDAHGTWRNDPTYGYVWFPIRVEVGWAPYRDGHWVWIDPWGWTWVDDAPWGFAVSHYGRWAHLGGRWAWVPGPVRSPAYYAPALVVFVGGSNFQLTISSGSVEGVAWFPLAPREVYRPSYAVSRSYFEKVNQSNTVVNNTVINNVYNNVNVTNIVNVNRQVAGAVVAVPATAFVQSQPVSRSAVRVAREAIVSQPVVVAPPVVPTRKSVHGAAGEADKPPPRVFARPVVARTAPAAVPVGIAVQQPKLTTKPGKPLDEGERRALRPAAAVLQAPVVKVLTPTPAASAPVRADRGRSQAPAKANERAAPRTAPRVPAQSAAQPRDEAPRKAAPARPVAVPAPAASPPAKRTPAVPPSRAASRAQESLPAASMPTAGRNNRDRRQQEEEDQDRKPRE